MDSLKLNEQHFNTSFSTINQETHVKSAAFYVNIILIDLPTYCSRFYTVHLDSYSLINGRDELGPCLKTSGSNLQGKQSYNVP